MGHEDGASLVAPDGRGGPFDVSKDCAQPHTADKPLTLHNGRPCAGEGDLSQQQVARFVVCSCGSVFASDAAFCIKCGAMRPEKPENGILLDASQMREVLHEMLAPLMGRIDVAINLMQKHQEQPEGHTQPRGLGAEPLQQGGGQSMLPDGIAEIGGTRADPTPKLREARSSKTVMRSDSLRSKGAREEQLQAYHKRVEGGKSVMDWMDTASLVLITANAIFLGVEAQVSLQAAITETASPDWLRGFNWLFALLFVVELGVKLWWLREKFWAEDDRFGNIFDACLAMNSVLDVVLEVFNFSFLRALRLLRAVRAAKMLRTVSYLHDMRRMVARMRSSLPTVLWAWMLLGMVLYLMSLMVVMAVESYTRNHGHDEALLARFPSFLGTIRTLFGHVFGGPGWHSSAVALGSVHWLYQAIFALFFGFLSFSAISVLTTAIGEASKSMCMMIQHDKDLVVQQTINEAKRFRLQLLQVFHDLFDGRSRITESQMKRAFQDEEIRALLKNMGVQVPPTAKLMLVLDKDNSGDVDLDELVDGIMSHGHLMAAVSELDNKIGYLDKRILDIREELGRTWQA